MKAYAVIRARGSDGPETWFYATTIELVKKALGEAHHVDPESIHAETCVYGYQVIVPREAIYSVKEITILE